MVTADLDGDGDTDVVATAHSVDAVRWWENTAGDGSAWTEHTVDALFGGAVSVHAADVDGDGDLDVLGAADIDDDIAWWENTAGDGTAWTKRTVNAAFGGATSVHAADVDGDGDLDVLGAADVDDEIAWFENTAGDGTAWTKRSVDAAFGGAASVAAADIDGDGDTDVLGAARSDHDIAWWENTAGDGSAWTRRTVDGQFFGAVSVAVADVDGDGDLDVMGAASSSGEIAWWENTAGDGTAWTKQTLDDALLTPRSVDAADVDGDGDVDALGATATDDEIAWWENTAGDGSAWTKRTISGAFSGAWAVRAADVDGDGDADVLGAAVGDDAVTWWENQTIHRSAVYPAEHRVDGLFAGARSVYAADVDGDGDLDVLGAAEHADDIAWWENLNGDGTAWTEHTVEGALNAAHSVYAADVDGDGDTDVLGAGVLASDIRWWENTNGDGTAWTQYIVDGSFGEARSVSAADMDGDGDTDILGAAFSADDITWWENTNGDGTAWTEHTVDGSFDGAFSAFAADVDGDGDTDVLGAALFADDITWWENTSGDGTAWTERTINGSFDSARSVVAADVDGDGDADVLGAAGLADDITWWENTNGDGTAWTKRTIDGAFDGASSVYAADVDGDGDTDVLGAAFFADDITWWENTNGDGTAWTEHTVDGAFNGATSVYAADMDGDGDTDVLGAANGANDISWWENRGGQFALPTADVAPTRVVNGATVAALEIDAVHRGRTGEQDVELVTFELLLENGTGTALTDAQADALLASLTVYLDDGSGIFEAGTDTAVETVSSFSLAAGVLTVSFADGDPNVQLAHGTPRKYFVALAFEGAASTASPDEIRTTHLTESSSTGEDADHDLPVTLELSLNLTSTVVEVNDPPVAAGDAVGLLEDSGTVAGNVLDGSSGGLDADEELDPLTALQVSGPANGVLVGGLATDGSFTYQPNPDFQGLDSFTYAAHDGFETGNTATVTITVEPVNDAPSSTVTAIHESDEDGGPQVVLSFATAISPGPPNESAQVLSFQVTNNDNPSLFLAGPGLAPDGTLTYTAAADAHGTAAITVQLRDDGGTDNGGVDASAPQDFDIVIGAVNDAPSFVVSAMHGSSEDAGPQSVPAFATGISPGPAESGQLSTFQVTGNDNPGLFLAGPSLSADGTLTYTAAADANGSAAITVQLMDDGGTDNGGVDTSAPQDFGIVIGAVNDAPSFSVPAFVAVDQDLGPQSMPGFATGVSPGPADEGAQMLTFDVVGNSDPALFSAGPALAPDGTLTFTSAASAVGIATITVELKDDGGTLDGGVDTSPPQNFEIRILDAIVPEVTALAAAPGGTIAACTELRTRTAGLVVTFSEAMADPAGDSDPGDVSNPANYQLIAAGPDGDLHTVACDALLGDDVLVPASGVIFDRVTHQATASYTPRLADGAYRLLVCDQLTDPTGNALAESLAVTFRQQSTNLFSNGQVDCGLEAWVPVSTLPEEIEHSAEDQGGASISGSIHMTNLSGTSFAVGQCVDSAGSSYRVEADVRVDGAPNVLVGLTTTCAFYGQADCAGPALSQASSLELFSDTAGIWQPVMHVADVAGAASSLCSFEIDLLAGLVFDAYLDDLVLSDSLFSDGFESGDVSSWSSATP